MFYNNTASLSYSDSERRTNNYWNTFVHDYIKQTVLIYFV